MIFFSIAANEGNVWEQNYFNNHGARSIEIGVTNKSVLKRALREKSQLSTGINIAIHEMLKNLSSKSEI